MLKHLSDSICGLTLVLKAGVEQRKIEFDWLRFHSEFATKQDLKDILMKLTEVKAAVASAAKDNREAIGEIGTKIADLNKQIADLIAGAGDPEITDEAFLTDLQNLQVDAKALADIVPAPVEPPAEPTP